jgi:hypothetical protein
MTDSTPNYDMDKPGDDLQACRERWCARDVVWSTENRKAFETTMNIHHLPHPTPHYQD